MYRYAAILACLASLCLCSIEARAQDEPGRYTLKTIENGFVRLDTKTGAVSTCRKQDGNIICRAAADDRAALQEEIDRLQTANDELRAKMAKRNDATAKKKSARKKADLPDDEEVDRIMSFFEKLMKRFFKFAQTMRETLGHDT